MGPGHFDSFVMSKCPGPVNKVWGTNLNKGYSLPGEECPSF